MVASCGGGIMFRLSAQDVAELKQMVNVQTIEELAGAFHCLVGYPMSAKYIRDRLSNFGELSVNYSCYLTALSIIIQQQRLLPPDKHIRPVLTMPVNLLTSPVNS